MELHRTEQGFALYKEKDCIGECTLSPAPKGAQLAALCILPRWRRKGYGSYLLKEVLRSFPGHNRHRFYRPAAGKRRRACLLGQIRLCRRG